MENDVNNDQPVTDPDVNGQVVEGQGETTDPATQTVDDTTQDKTVPYDRFKEVNDQKKAAEEQAAYAQRQLELMQQQTMQTQQVQQTQYSAPMTTMEQAMQELGLEADDLYGENILKVQKRTTEIDSAKNQQGQLLYANQQFMMSHPDTQQVVGSVHPTTGQLMTASPELYAILAKNPYLAGACGTLQGAYEIVMTERQLTEVDGNNAAQDAFQAKKNVDVTTQPMGGSAAGGGGGGTTQGQGLMSRDQVAQIDADIKAGKYS